MRKKEKKGKSSFMRMKIPEEYINKNFNIPIFTIFSYNFHSVF